MNGLCKFGRISTSVLKAYTTKNQFLKSRIIVAGNLSYSQAVLENKFIQEHNANKNYLKSSLPLVTFARQISTTSPRLSSHKGDHSKLWTIERGLSIALLGTVPTALLYPCQALDTALALLIVVHTHFGLEAIVIDYIRPILFGDMAPKIGLGLLYLFSAITLGGLLNLIYNDCGLANTIINIWKK